MNGATRRWTRLVAMLATIACLTVGMTAVDARQTEAGALARAGRTAAVEADELERLLPPGARQVLSAFRIFQGISARNSVYREADRVQRELREYYDAQIATAQRQLTERTQLGLQDSQLRAYVRVLAQLRAERDAAIAVTEFEKRVAKYGFESAFRRELVSAISRVPRVREGLDRMRETVGGLQTQLGVARDAIRTGNPVAAVATEISDTADRLERIGGAVAVISGPAGQQIAAAAAAARSTVAPVTEALDGADRAAGTAIDELDELIEEIDRQTGAERSPRSGLDVIPEDEGSVIEEILTPTGDEPTADAVAGVIGRQATERARQRGTDVDEGTMRDRVRTEVLQRDLDRISEACGRIVGAVRRAQLDAAAAGAPLPWARRECPTYDNPDALDELIDEVRSGRDERVEAAASAEAGDDDGDDGNASPDESAGLAASEDSDSTEQGGEAEGEDEEAVRRVFRGSGTMTSTLIGECAIELDYELVLNPDSTATLFLSEVVTAIRNPDDTPACRQSAAQLYSGSWAPGDRGPVATIVIGSTEFTMDAEVIDHPAEGPPAVATLAGSYFRPRRTSTGHDLSGTFSFTIPEIEL